MLEAAICRVLGIYHSVLQYSIETADVSLVQYLVSKGMNIYASNRITLTSINALFWATATGNCDIVKYLVE